MSSEAKWTKGKFFVCPNPDKNPIGNFQIESDDYCIALTVGCAVFEAEKADAELIAECFNVATETGLTPRQLADQRAELVAALRECIAYMPTNDPQYARQLENPAKLARAILAKCGQQK